MRCFVECGFGTEKLGADQGEAPAKVRPAALHSVTSLRIKSACGGGRRSGGRWTGVPKVRMRMRSTRAG